MAKEDSGFAEIEDYTKKLTQNPDSLVFVPLAEAYRKNGMLDEAIETCLKGLQIHPTYMSARMVLGRTYMEKENYEEAAGEFRKVSAADVNNIMAHSLLGQIYVKQGKYSGAVDEYQKVLSLNPDDGHAQQMLTQALELAKTSGAAKGEAVPAGDADTKKEISQAEAFTKQGDIDNAIKIYNLILEADPENLLVRQRLKDLELRKVQFSNERKSPERPKTDNFSHHDNDKITSDDILSVMKDTIPKAPEKAKAASKPAAEEKPESKPEPKPAHKPEAKPDAGSPLSAALTKLAQTPGIVGTLLLDNQGGILESTFKGQSDLKEMAQTATLLFEKTGKAVSAMDHGNQVKQILITGEKGQIYFNKFSQRILLVQADENINIGKMRLAMMDVNKALQ